MTKKGKPKDETVSLNKRVIDEQLGAAVKFIKVVLSPFPRYVRHVIASEAINKLDEEEEKARWEDKMNQPMNLFAASAGSDSSRQTMEEKSKELMDLSLEMFKQAGIKVPKKAEIVEDKDLSNEVEQ
jgi:hypothetical protein